jgi:hypothetical protein
MNAPAPIPSLTPIVLWRVLEFLTVVGESMVSFFALANSGGLDPTNLAVEYANGAAFSIVGWAFAAVIISALLFVITEWAFCRIGAATEDATNPAHAFRLTTGIAALVFVVAVVVGISCLRAQLGSINASIGMACIFFVIGAAPLVGGALVHLHANALSVARGEALRVEATPNAADVAQRLRTEHEELLIEQRDRLRMRRDQLTASIQLLNAQMHGAEQAVRDIARHETRVVLEWIDSLRAGLAVDQKYFEHYARAWNRSHLLVSAPPAPEGALVPMVRKRRMP